MTKRKTASELVDGATRNLKTMRQHRDALDDGSISENDVEVMALRRVLEQLGARDESTKGNGSLPAMTLFNAYACDEGQPLFAARYEDGEPAFDSLPSWVHVEDAVAGLTTDPTALPARFYSVYVHQENGRPQGVYVDLNYAAA